MLIVDRLEPQNDQAVALPDHLKESILRCGLIMQQYPAAFYPDDAYGHHACHASVSLH